MSGSYALSFNTFNFDPSANTLYFIKRDPAHKGKKAFLKKEEKEEDYNNIVLWEIGTQKKHFLFGNDIALTQQIRGFYFEHSYNEQEQEIVFNREVTQINYKKLPQRTPKDLLFIETVHPETKVIQLWYANKKGQGLKKIAQLSNNAEWHLDMGNDLLRIIQHKKRDVIIQEIPWQLPNKTH